MEDAIQCRRDFSELDTLFHTRIAECAHNTVMQNLIPVIAGGVSVFASEVAAPEYEQTLRSHRKIFEAIKNRHPSEAERQMRFHLLFNTDRFRRDDCDASLSSGETGDSSAAYCQGYL